MRRTAGGEPALNVAPGSDVGFQGGLTGLFQPAGTVGAAEPEQAETGTHRLLAVLRRRQDALEQQGCRRSDRGELGLEMFGGVARHRAMGGRLVGFQRRPAAGGGTGMAGNAPAAQEDADQGGGRVNIDRLADRGVGHRVGGAIDHDMVIGRQLVAAPGAWDEAVRRQRWARSCSARIRVRQVVLSPLNGAAFSAARRSRIAALAASRLTKTVSRTGASTRRSTCKTAFSTAALSLG